MEKPRTEPSTLKTIFSLALPTFGQLVAEPVFILIDTAIVGHISDAALAGLSIGSTIVLTTVGLCIFLAYSTTSRVAQLIGQGKRAHGLQAGIDGMWLALVLGGLISVLVAVFAGQLCWALGARGAVYDQALRYLRPLAFSIPGTLLVYAANGIFRGLFRVRLPLVAAVGGAIINTGLDFLLIFGLGWGIMGSGVATLISQWLMAGFLTVLAVRWAQAGGAHWQPGLRGILSNASDGLPLFIRTLALRVALVATVAVAARLGTLVLASYQAVNSVWNLSLNMLDAVGIASQSVVGAAIGRRRERLATSVVDTGGLFDPAAFGSGTDNGTGSAAAHPTRRRHFHLDLNLGLGRSLADTEEIHALTTSSARAGALMGIVVGLLLIALSGLAARQFSPNPDIRQLILAGLVTVGLFCPFQGWVWSLDGVLIGAGDYRYLAAASIISSGIYLLALGGLLSTASADSSGNATWLVVALWLIFNLFFMGARGLANGLRAKGDGWLVK